MPKIIQNQFKNNTMKTTYEISWVTAGGLRVTQKEDQKRYALALISELLNEGAKDICINKY